jgi:hypothetical protein
MKLLRTVFTAVALGICLLASSTLLAATETRFTIVDSSPTSWVARGYDNYTVSPAKGWSFSMSESSDHSITIYISGTPLPGTTVDYWRLVFAAPNDAMITPGFYADLQRYPFNDANHPGLSFASTGRLDNRAGGFFQVFEANSLGTPAQSFSANFTHYGETNTNNYAVVQIRYNATVVPEPSTILLAIIGFATLPTRRRVPHNSA